MSHDPASPLPVMLVEDDDDHAALFGLFCRRHQLELDVRRAENGEAALRMIETELADPGDRTPIVVLLDLNLPRLNGLELLEILAERETTRELRVVVVSSSSRESDCDAAERLGACGYIEKPVTLDTYRRIIQPLLDPAPVDRPVFEVCDATARSRP